MKKRLTKMFAIYRSLEVRRECILFNNFSIENNSGEHEYMTIVSQKSLKEINECEKMNSERKLISLKAIPAMNEIELNEFNFYLN